MRAQHAHGVCTAQVRSLRARAMHTDCLRACLCMCMCLRLQVAHGTGCAVRCARLPWSGRSAHAAWPTPPGSGTQRRWVEGSSTQRRWVEGSSTQRMWVEGSSTQRMWVEGSSTQRRWVEGSSTQRRWVEGSSLGRKVEVTRRGGRYSEHVATSVSGRV